MKIIFSPSKSQKISTLEQRDYSTPIFDTKATKLRSVLRAMTKSQLKDLYMVSDKLFQKIYKQLHSNDSGHALLSFTGTSFSSLSIEEYTQQMHSYAQEHVSILSALYGVLRPDDGISSYRLDMTDKVLDRSLYAFWKEDITEYFSKEDQIINLASDEYAKMLTGIDPEKIYTIHFIQRIKGVDKSVSVFSKQQRGNLLNWMVINLIKDIDLLKEYSSDGYLYDVKLSDKQNLYYVREC